MPLYQFVKALPNSQKKPFFKRKNRNSWRISFIFISVGGTILIWAFWPIISFTVFTAPLLAGIVSPVVEGKIGPLTPLVSASGGVLGGADFANANLWFPTKPQKKIVTPVNTYKLSIPRLKIKDSTVTIAGDDLNKSLVHYGGTGFPGQYGTTVIFGHSVLPQFFNPTNYETIFSTLPTLKSGDDIFVTYDGVDYRYVVYDMVVTDPSDLSVLEQNFDDSYLTLITCVPPGTIWKRLSVRARLVKFST